MAEDCIVLSFNLQESVSFKIGDYIDDEIFGRFYITEEPVPPEYIVDTGAYKYDLTFSREYIGFKNYVFMLTYGSTRRETNWTLTDKLSVHLDEIIRNLAILGFSYSYVINVDESEQAASITYSGTDIYSALNTLANTYQCEWWVNGNVIYFGKCEVGDAIEFNLANTESIAPSRNDDDYANRLYVFGSTQNIPDTYRKELVFKVSEKKGVETAISLTWTDNKQIWNGTEESSTDNAISQVIDVSSYDWLTLNIPSYMCMLFKKTGDTYTIISPGSGHLVDDYDVRDVSQVRLQAPITEKSAVTCTGKVDGVYFRDANRVLKPYMVAGGDEEVAFTPTKSGNDFSQSLSLSGGDYTISGTFTFKVNCVAQSTGNIGKVTFKVYIDSTLIKTEEVLVQNGTGGPWSGTQTLTLSLNETAAITSGTMVLKINTAITVYNSAQITYDSFESDISLTSSGIPVSMNIVVGGSNLAVVYNEPQDYNGWFKCSSGSIDVGTEFTIDETYLNVTRIPTSYYQDTEGDPNSLRLLGERRLMLPEGTSYIGDSLPKEELVEKVVIFEYIFPRCALRITSITERVGTLETEYTDGSSRKNEFTQYTIKAKRITGSGDVDFPFSKEYLTSSPLQVKFITPDEEIKYSDGTPHGKSGGYLLSGMTFDVQWNESESSYTIAWNSDYGAQLPNSTLKPKVGDPFILIGWNTKAMASLGLIASAENELASAGSAYLAAIEDSSFTFDCRMMSDWASTNGVLAFGQKVTVVRGELNKTSRVIGYELKLDIPEDTPHYTIGETEAYSTLRNLQKQLNAISLGNASSSGSVVIQNTGTGGTPSEGGGASSLADLDDVDIDGIEGGDHLIWDSDRNMMVVDKGGSDFFEKNAQLQTLVQLKTIYSYLGTRNGLVFDTTAEADVASSPAHLMLRNLGTAQNPNYALYSPLPLITGGDQIVISGTPGQGGGGGGAGYLYELNDVADALQSPATGTMIFWNGSEWAGSMLTSLSNGDILQWDATNARWKNVTASSIGGVTSVVGQRGDISVGQIASALTTAGYELTDHEYTNGYGLSLSNGEFSLTQAVRDSLGLADTALQAASIKTMTLKVGTATVGTYNPIGASNTTLTVTAQNLYDTIGSTKYHPFGGENDASSAKTFYIGGALFTWHPQVGTTPGYLELNSAIVTGGDQIVVSGTPGQGGGGGGAGYLYELDDVNHDSDKTVVLRPNNQPRGDGDVLSFDSSLGVWVALQKSSLLSGYALESYVDSEIRDSIQALNLGAASTYGVGTVASGNNGLVTGGSVYSAINDAVSSALKFQGTTTTAISDGSTTNPIVIGGSSYTAKKGDVVLYDGREFLWTGSAWEQLGDEVSWALKTTTISAGTGLTGGGTLAANRTISLDSATIASLALADTAYQKPSTGIPKSDLASGVQTSLGLADSAYQKPNDGIPNSDLKYSWVKVGTTQIDLGGQQTSLAGLVNVTMSGKLTIGSAEITWVNGQDGNPGHLEVSTALVTNGDQIVNSGTPGGGGGGGGAGFLYELGDVLTDSGHTVVKQYDGSTNAANNNLFAFNGSTWYALKLGSNLAISSGTLNATNTTYSNGTGLALSNGVFSITSAYQTDIANGASAYSTLTTSQAKNKVLASPSSASGAPSFRALVAADLPSIENLTNFSTRVYDATTSRTANYVLAAPNGSNGAATFRKLVAADIPSLTVSKITDIASNYVSIATANTITAKHTFSNGILLNTASSWTSSDRAIAFSADGEDANIRYYSTDSSKGLTFNPNTGELKAAKFTRRGGTSSQFLKADGSVDSSSYITGNQTITLSGDVSGSGSTSISVSIGAGKVTNNMLAGSIANGKLANSAITINGSSTSLGGSFSTASITAGTAGTSSATSGLSISVPYVTMNAYGIVTGYGTHTHSISKSDLTTALEGSSGYYVKKDGDTMSGDLIIEKTGGGCLTVRGKNANSDGGYIYLAGRYLSNDRNGCKIAAVYPGSGAYDIQDLVFYSSNNRSGDATPVWVEAMRIKADTSVTIGQVESITMKNGCTIKVIDNADTPSSLSALYMSSNNNLILGYGTATAGYNTYIYGNELSFRYGTSSTIGMRVNSSGNVTIGATDLAGTTSKLYVDGALVADGLTIQKTGGGVLSLYGTAHNGNAGEIVFQSMGTQTRNGAKISAVAGGTSCDLEDLVFYTSNNTTSPYAPDWQEAMRIKADKAVSMNGSLSISRGGVYNIYTNNTASDGTASGIRFQLNGTTKGGLFVSSDENLYYSVGTASTGDKVLTSANYDGYALPLAGGTMTGSIKLTNGTYINAASGYAMCGVGSGGETFYCGPGAEITSAFYIRSGNINLTHVKAGTNYTIWDASNSNLSTVDWAANNLTVAGTSTFSDTMNVENRKYMQWKDSGGTYRNTFGLNNSNSLLIGYGLSSVTGSSTVIYGETVRLQAANINEIVKTGGATLVMRGTQLNSQVHTILFRGSDSESNGFKIQTTAASSYGRQSLGFYRSNVTSGSAPYTPVWKRSLYMPYDGGVIIGTSSDACNLTVYGSITSSGDQVISSDASLKKNWRDLKYGVADIAKATAGVFDWKDGKGESAGTKAQDWMHLVPQLVHGEEGHMTLAYGQIAMLNSILIARSVVKHEDEITVLRRRVAELEKEVEQLKMN